MPTSHLLPSAHYGRAEIAAELPTDGLIRD
jgi:hypothetical protein